MSQPLRSMVSSAFFEAFFVVLGVILALGANEWRQERAAQAHAGHALAAIVEEMQANRDLVQAATEYHQDRIGAIYAAHGRGETLAPAAFPRGFVAPGKVFQTAWDAASETGALGKLDFATVLALSRVYAAQERYVIQSRMAGEVIYAQIFQEGSDSVVAKGVNLGSIIGTFLYRESELIALYDETLASLDADS